MNTQAVRAIATFSHIDLVSAIKTKRHNPILDSEIHIEEELINLRESIESYHAAGETIRDYPQVFKHVSDEKTAILKHCIGLIIRMMHGKQLPQPYTTKDAEFAIRRLVQLYVLEAKRMGKKLDADAMAIFRPYLTVLQRVGLRDFGMDLVVQASQVRRLQGLPARLQQLRSRKFAR